jgi:2-isopropylmalate synthase
MVHILDSTLREGEQTPGVYFDPHIKLAIAQLLDAVGVDFIEAGHPRVGPEIHSVVRTLGSAGLKATVAAHARSLHEDVDMALECGVGMLGIFYCVSDRRLAGVFQKGLDEAVEQIASVIAYAKSQQPDLLVRYTPEDTVRSEHDNVIAATVAAVKAGADIISIADTTGLMVPGTPHNLYDYVRRLKSELEHRNLAPMIAVHCHNDRGLALANALDAVRAGADIIDVSVLGLGERAGIVDMAQLMAVLDQDFQLDHSWRLDKLPELYSLVSRYAGVPIPQNYPIVGANAFTHCAGVHTQAANQNPLHYRSLDPALFGRVEHVCLDHMSGGASIDYGLRQLGIDDVDAETRRRLLAEVKSIGQKGRTVSTEELAHLVAFCSARDAQPTEVS